MVVSKEIGGDTGAIGGADGSTGGVSAIRLVLEVLESLAKQDSVGVTELANSLGTTKARVFRHLRTLVDQGYAVQDKGDRYEAGPKLIALARIAGLAPDDGIVRLARPTMMRLRDEFGHTVNFSLVYGESASIVETLQGSSFVGVVMRRDIGLPLHSTAAGKLLLSEMQAAGRPFPNQPFQKLTENTIIDPETLGIELAQIKKQGWAAAPEETVLGVNALSAPIFDHRGELVAMISMLSSIQFISRQPARAMVGGVISAAAEISAAMSL